MTTTATPGRELLVKIDDVRSLLSTCRHDGGFDRELGPIGCNLDADDADGCVCAAITSGLTRLAAMPASSSVQLSELDAASNACLELCSRHGFATGHGDTVADIVREIDAQIGERLAAKPADEGWQDISTAPRGVKLSVARKGGRREDGSIYWYQASGHFSLMDGIFHFSDGELYGAPELWHPYPKNPEHCTLSPSTTGEPKR